MTGMLLFEERKPRVGTDEHAADQRIREEIVLWDELGGSTMSSRGLGSNRHLLARKRMLIVRVSSAVYIHIRMSDQTFLSSRSSVRLSQTRDILFYFHS